MMEINRLQPMECRQVRKLLDDFLSDELSVDVSRQLLVHMDGCAVCCGERTERLEMRELLRDGWNSLRAPAGLSDSIRGMVEAETPRVSWLPVAAGLLVVFLGVAAMVMMLNWFSIEPRPGVGVDHYAAAVEDHLRCSGTPVGESDLPMDPHYPELRAALDTLAPGFSLVGVMECRVHDAVFLHYLYRRENGALFSVMLEGRDPGEALAARGEPVRILDLQARSVELGPVVVTGAELSRYFVYLIGDGMDRQQSLAAANRLVPLLIEVLG